VRHSFVDASSRLDLLEATQLELKSIAVSGQEAVAACLSDVGLCCATHQDLQIQLKQLQQGIDSVQQRFNSSQLQIQQQQCTDNLLHEEKFFEVKVQCKQLQDQLDGIKQQQLRDAQLYCEQSHFQDRLLAVEQSQAQLREQHHGLQQQLQHQLLMQIQQDRSDLQRLLEDKFEAIHHRMTQLESHRESWTTIERLVLSGSSGSGNGNVALPSNYAISDAQSPHHDFSGSEEMGNSYVSLQTSLVAAAATELESRPSLQVVSVSVRFPRFPTPPPSTCLKLSVPYSSISQPFFPQRCPTRSAAAATACQGPQSVPA